MNTVRLHAPTSAEDAITVRIPRRGEGLPNHPPRVIVHPRFDPRCAPTQPRIRRDSSFTSTLVSAGVVVPPRRAPAPSRAVEIRWLTAFILSVLLIASTTIVATVMQFFA